MDVSTWAPWALICGRIAVGGLYVVAGVEHLVSVTPLTRMLASRGIPFPRLSLVVSSVLQALAGLAIVFGVLQTWAALALIVFTIVASVVVIDFWNQEGTERTSAIQAWQSNAALIGGLLIVAALPAGPS